MSKTQTSTQIRNLYSPLSYLNVSFYNLSLAFGFSPFLQKGSNGTDQYDTNATVRTTIDFDSAYTLFNLSKNILNNPNDNSAVNVSIPVNGGTLTFDRKMENGKMETYLIINKDNKTIPFVFKTIPYMENGVQKFMNAGLGTFMKTIEGYLTGVNAERHLNKMTEEYAKVMEKNANSQQKSGGFNSGAGVQYKNQNTNWKNNNQNRNNWKSNNQNGNWKNNRNNQQNGGWQPKQQGYSELNIED